LRKVDLSAIIKEDTAKLNQNVRLGVKGFEYREPRKPNAFLNPNEPNAEFPQHKPAKIIDFRFDH